MVVHIQIMANANTTRMAQLEALYKRLLAARADAVDAFDAAEPGPALVAAMEREHRVNRLVSIVKHTYRARHRASA